VDRYYKLHGSQHQRPNSSCEGYIHGTLSTAGIQGASPAMHSVPRQKQLLQELDTAADSTAAALNAACHMNSNSTALTGSVCRPNLLGQFSDPGMRPKVLIPASTNRPDLTHTTADIEGAQPDPKDVCHHPRDTNPLSPQYKLASGRSARVTWIV
jgi:hypothetical protein